MGALRWPSLSNTKMTSSFRSLSSSQSWSPHYWMQSNVLSLWAPQILPQILESKNCYPAIQHSPRVGAPRPNDYHHPRTDAQLWRSRRRWMVLPRWIPLSHPLHLLQEASNQRVSHLLRRVRSLGPARPRAHVDALELRHQLLQRLRQVLSHRTSLLLLIIMTQEKPLALRINQRNLYRYFLHHQKKYGNTPCFVPRCPSQNSRVEQYITAVERLEEHGLIRINRSGGHYTAWIMLAPKKQ